MYHFSKPSGPMQDDIRRAVEELVDRNNPHLALSIINNALANTEFSVQTAATVMSTSSSVPTTASPPLRGSVGTGVISGQVVHSGATGGGVVVGTVKGVGNSNSAPTTSGGAVVVGRQPMAANKRGSPAPSSASGSTGATAAVTSSSTAGLSASSVAGVSPSASTTTSFPYPRRALEIFNPVQLERLLLLRSDAYAMIFSHEKSLKDALAAVEVSGHQSPLAFFTVGRQHRHLWAIEDAVMAFNTAESLFSSVVHAYLQARNDLANAAAGAAVAAGSSSSSPGNGGNSSGNNTSSWSLTQCLEMAVWNQKRYGGWLLASQRRKTDEEEAMDFWAAHGFSPAEVAEMGLTPMEYEMQQAELQRSRELHRRKQAAAAAAALQEPQQQPPRSGTTSKNTSAPSSPSPSPSPHPKDEVAEEGGGVSAGGPLALVDHPEDQLSDLELLTLFGMDHHEVSVWRRLVMECRALLAVNVSQTIPSSTISAALTTLMPKVNNVRNGVIVAIENGSTQTMRFVGATLNGCGHLPGHTFPRTIPKGHVGVLLLQPTAWTGYHGSLCFELDEELLNCFLYFDLPIMSSKKVGVRLVEHRAADLRVAFDEVNNTLNGGGITTSTATTNNTSGAVGGSSSSGPASPPVTAATSPKANNNNATSSGSGVGPNRVAPRIAATTAGVRLVKIPSNSVWLASHTANSSHRRVKVVGRAEEARVVHFVVAEIPPEPLSPVELLPALEYAGPHVLKRLSSVNRAYRRLVNHLPPLMFSSSAQQQQQQQQQRSLPRVSYPDYLLAMDRYSSPWVVRDRGQVQWRIISEARLIDRVEYSVVDISALAAATSTSTSGVNNSSGNNNNSAVSGIAASSSAASGNSGSPVLWISSEIQSREGTIFHGDPQRRSMLTHIRDHWGLFVNNMFCCETPNGSQFAKITQPATGQFQLTFEGYGNTPEQVMYTARKHFTRPVTAGTTGVTGSRYQDPTTISGSVSGTAPRSPGTARYTSGRVIGAGSSVTSPATSTASGAATSSFSAAAAAQKSSLSTSSPPSTASPPMSSTANNLTSTEVHYSVWRPRQECGASLMNCPPQNTNGGEELIAEIITVPQMAGRRAPVIELHMNPGADALLVTLLAYGILRW